MDNGWISGFARRFIRKRR